MDAEQTRVYVPNGNVSWVEATITKGHVVNDDTVEVVLIDDPEEEDAERQPEGGTELTVMKNTVLLQNKNVGPDGCEDMVNLNYLHEPAILFNLKQRFFRQLPYTYTGPICIAVNPYAWLDIYTQELQDLYLEKDRAELPPHVYATSAGSYQHMRTFGEDQSILVSGESGAGKTETTKILMSHLAAAGGRVRELENETGIIAKVLDANPLMESFGNAKTSRNDNSSRFGKFSELQFNAIGQLIGARSRTYLLEKSRVSIQGLDERNYHIFYQLLAAPESVTSQVELRGMTAVDFPFIHNSSSDVGNSARDAQKFQQTVACLDTIGVPAEDRLGVFQIVAAVLHLSRLQFDAVDGNDDVSCLRKDAANNSSEKIVSQLLQFPTEELQKALCTRQMSLSASETYQVPLNVQQAQSTRTALAVALYSQLFGWLAQRINHSTSAAAHDVTNKIFILDIFGFEIFDKNSFEQLCINYANEKLQQKFTQDVFKSIQVEYEEEGIPWTKIEFSDNINVLSLIEGRFGVLSLLNEECMRPKGSDAAFANKLRAHYGDNDRFECPRFARDAFVIKHYAGSVMYDTNGFLIKNTDSLQNDLLVLISKSTSPFVKHLFPNDGSVSSAEAARPALRRRTSIIADTVGTQFKSQLNGLMEDIRRTNVHYIRCIKPNSKKSSQIFSKSRVTEQLQCAGVVEAVRISRCAFPNRLLQTVFLERFRGVALASSGSAKIDNTEDIATTVRNLLENHLMPNKSDEYQIGKTRIFFRKGALEALEEMRSRKLNLAAVVLQRYAKKWMAMAIFRAVRNAVILMQSTYRGYHQRASYRKLRKSTILAQSVIRRHRCQLLLAHMRKQYRATVIQRNFKMHVCRTQYRKELKSIKLIQSVVRMFLAVRSFAVLQTQAKEDAKLENQIQLLKKRLQEERQARLELEQQASSGMRSSISLRTGAALEDADAVIDQLRRENAALKEANSNLKAFSLQVRKEKEVMERGAYVNGASFAAANQRATKLQEEVEVLKSAHARIKLTHRLLKDQNMAAMENVNMLQNGLNEALNERMALRHSVEQLKKHSEHLQNENVALAKANARLRLILRQDPELSRKHREEVPRLTKLAHTAKQAPVKATPAKAVAPKVVDLMEPSTATPESEVPLPTKETRPLSGPVPALSTSNTGGGVSVMLGLKRANGLIGTKSKSESSKTLRVVNILDHSAVESGSTTSDSSEGSSTSAKDEAPTPVIRQPTGEDGPIKEPGKVMGLVSEHSEEDNETPVSFSVTLGVDSMEEAKTQQQLQPPPQRASFSGNRSGSQKQLHTKSKSNRRSSYDRSESGSSKDLTRRGSFNRDRDSFGSENGNSRGSSLRQSFSSGPPPGLSGEGMRNSSLRQSFNSNTSSPGGNNRARNRSTSFKSRQREGSTHFNNHNNTPGMGGKRVELTSRN